MIDFDAIIDDIKCGQIIPIIGDEVLYTVNESGDKVSLQNYILQKLNEEYKQQVQEYSFKNMTVFERLLKSRKTLIRRIKKIIASKEIKIEPCILHFLRNGEFPLIITTTYTDVLERVLSGYVSVDYCCDKIHDIGEIAYNDKNKRLANKTIFHLFGSLEDGGLAPCVVTEDDFLTYLHGLSDTNTSPQKLREYIQNKGLERREILALGCNIPDWVFRFLLYSMVKEDLFVNKDQSFKGGVIDSANDANLAAFLENIAYYYGSNILSFIEEINSRLQPQIRHSIFVSVFSEDLNSPVHGRQIREIIDKLKTRYDVWYCGDRLQSYAGEAYWLEIRKGLEECEFFLPIITDKVLNLIPSVNGAKPTDDRGDQGIINEWKYALKAWKEHHSYPKPYVLPYRFDVSIDRLKKAFCIPNNPGADALCHLVFGPNCVGAQSVESVEEIDLDKLLKQ